MLQAVIFDFDGVIVDSERHHLHAFQHVLREENIDLDDHMYYSKYLGLDDRHCFEAMLKDARQSAGPDEIQELIRRKAVFYESHQKDVQMLPGAAAFIRTASARYPTAIGSGALRQEIAYVLKRADVFSCISVLVGAEDVEHSKPAPDCYLTVLERLNEQSAGPVIAASKCVVIEDTARGIEAARAAGMRCVGVTTSCPADALSGADQVVPGLHALSLEQLELIF